MTMRRCADHILLPPFPSSVRLLFRYSPVCMGSVGGGGCSLEGSVHLHMRVCACACVRVFVGGLGRRGGGRGGGGWVVSDMRQAWAGGNVMNAKAEIMK